MHLSLTHPDSRRLTDYSSKIEMIPREYIGIAVQPALARHVWHCAALHSGRGGGKESDPNFCIFIAF